MNRWRLLITRPTDENRHLAALLNQHGIHSCDFPLLSMQALSETPEQRELMLNLERYSSILVVSKPAARFALERLDTYWPQPPMRPKWFSVGAATGHILRDYGLDADWPKHGDDSEALLALPSFIQSLEQPSPKLLIMRADTGREFLAQQICNKGISVDFLPLYERFLPNYPVGALLERIRTEELNGLVVSSGQGLEHLIHLAGQDWPTIAQLPLFVPSPRVAQIAAEAGATHVIDCRGASNQALLDTLSDTPH